MYMLTPLEIENMKFSKQLVNGYNTDEIDEFLDDILKDYETLYKENIELKDKTSSLNDGITHYKSMEDMLQSTLILAQNTAEEVKENAKKEAETILASANQKVSESLSDINQKLTAKQIEYDELQKQFDVYKAKMESLLISQLELLKGQNRDI